MIRSSEMESGKGRKVAAGRSLRAEDIMSHPVASVREDALIREAAKVMSDRGVSGLAVLDSAGKAVGVVSASDVVRHDSTRRTPVLSDRDYERLKSKAGDEAGCGVHLERIDDEPVAEIMTPRLVRAAPESSVGHLAWLMHQNRIHRVFIERAGRIVGLVTALDVARAVGEKAGPEGLGWDLWIPGDRRRRSPAKGKAKP